MKRLLLFAWVSFAILGGTTTKTSYHNDYRQSVNQVLNPVFHPDKNMEGEALAWAFLRDKAQLFGWNEHSMELRLDRIKTSLIGEHYYFAQYHHGIPVENGMIVVSINGDQQVYAAYNNLYPGITLSNTKATLILEEDAYDIAWQDLAVHGDLMAAPQARMTIWYTGKNFVLGYVVDLAVNAPFGYWRHWIDATTGSIEKREETAISRKPKKNAVDNYDGPVDNRAAAFRLFRQEQARRLREKANSSKNAARVDGSGQVFDPDPRTTLMSEGMRDGDQASTFTAAYFTRSLRDLTNDAGTFRLIGPFITIADFEPPNTLPSTTTTGTWTATRGDNAFNDAVTYFHIDQNQRYMQSLGFTGPTGIQELSIETDADGVNGDDNSHFIPSTNQMAFGHGCVDDNEDAFVILHEYGHAIQHSIAGSNWSGGDTGGMGEGFGDYWGGSYKYSTPNGPTFHPEWAFPWDGHHDCWSGRIMNLTGAQYNPNLTYGAHATVGGVLSDELWSTPLFQTLIDIIDGGGSREDADQIILESHFGIGSGMKMRGMAERIVQTAGTLFPGSDYAGLYFQQFAALNIVASPLSSSGDVTITDAGSDTTADPGESVAFKLSITNISGTTISGITGTISTDTQMVTVSQANSAFPDVANGQSVENSTDFVIDIDSGFTCGNAINIDLNLDLNMGTRRAPASTNLALSFAYIIQTGTPDGTFTMTETTPVAIPDNNVQGADSLMTISGSGLTVNGGFNVDIDLTHTYIGDLEISLTSPTGTSVTLHNNSGGTTDNIQGNYPGTLTPAESLSAFAGEPLDGTWTMHMVDSAGGDTGTLNSWSINSLTYACNEGDPCGSLDPTEVKTLWHNDSSYSSTYDYDNDGDIDILDLLTYEALCSESKTRIVMR